MIDMNRTLAFLTIVALLTFAVPQASAQTEKTLCAVYFTGIGCPHCANADPYVLNDLLVKHPELVVIEYELYQIGENAPLLYSYDEVYDSGMGVPLLIFDRDNKLIGDIPIIQNAEAIIGNLGESGCPLLDGKNAAFAELDISSLPGKPKMWTRDRVLIPGSGSDNAIMKELLTEDDITKVVEGMGFSLTDSEPMPLSGSSVEFQHALMIGDTKFQWNGECIWTKETSEELCDNTTSAVISKGQAEITVVKLVSLAAVDAVNPCALAVLTLMLIAILTYNPGKKRNILLAGAAFTVSVFVMYMVYGLVIIKFFQLIQAITYIRLTLYKILGLAAIILGLLNLKDFFWYKPGGLMTEMPIFMRPRLKKVLGGITSPAGAFAVGAFVTIFLLPCTIGPYIIAGGILSAMDLLQTIPLLLLYNLIFVLPMVAITIVVYLGVREVENVSGWKDRNIRYLHLVAGAIIVLLGVAMLMGWV